MELKWWKYQPSLHSRSRSNRTFMELKYLSDEQINPGLHCSNRTFMELKYISSSISRGLCMF